MSKLIQNLEADPLPCRFNGMSNFMVPRDISICDVLENPRIQCHSVLSRL